MSRFEALVDEAVRRLRRRTPRARRTTWTTDLGSLLGQGRASARALDMSMLKLIRDKGGYALKLIIKKKLYHSDVDEGQSRLSMPLKQILSDDFLNRYEKMILNRSTENGVVVRFIGPCREETTMVLTKRNFTRSSSYVLIGNWHNIAMKNGLKKGDTVQVWFFRANNRPWFALVKP